MGDDKRFGTTRHGKSRGFILAFACLAMLAGGCSKSEPDKSQKAENADKPDRCVRYQPPAARRRRQGSLRQRGDHDLYVAGFGRADRRHARQGARRRRLAENTSRRTPRAPAIRAQRIMSLKKGTQALNVFITIAPAQNNATSVQYAAVALKTDLPFPKDASNIEYSPDRPLLTAVTARAGRQDAGFLSQGACRARLVAVVAKAQRQAAGRRALRRGAPSAAPMPITSTTRTDGGAGAHAAERRGRKDQSRSSRSGRSAILETLHKAFVNSDNTGAALVDVSQLPRLEGAKEDAARYVIGRG